jgi:hypothetical protein
MLCSAVAIGYASGMAAATATMIGGLAYVRRLLHNRRHGGG